MVSETSCYALIVKNLNIISMFLAKRDMESLSMEKIKCPNRIVKGKSLLIVMVNADIFSIKQAVCAYQNQSVDYLMFVGGIGHSTPYIRENINCCYPGNDIIIEGKSESMLAVEVAEKYLGLAPNDILIETRSRNCGENAKYALDIARKKLLDIHNVILMQDPTMQLRTYETFKKLWRHENINLLNFAASVPLLKNINKKILYSVSYFDKVWTIERFISLLLGEMERIIDTKNGYGPLGKGYIEHVIIPEEVEKAYNELLINLPNKDYYQRTL